MKKFSDNQLLQAFAQLMTAVCGSADLYQNPPPALYKSFMEKEQAYAKEVVDSRK
jgi:hypothetical protein